MYENLQGFFESTKGQIITVVVMIAIFLIILVPNKGQKKNKPDIKALTVSALLIALALALGQIKLFSMPQGGSVTLLSMLPIAICGYLLGTRRGVMAGICLGLLNLILGPYVIHPVQLLIDYPLAFGAMGMGAFLRDKKYGLTKVYIVGVLCRYVFAVLSGVIFFGAYAPEGFSALTWSLWYNITYLAVEAAITTVVINIPPVSKMFQGLKKQF